MTIERVARAMSWSLLSRVATFVASLAASVMIVRSLDLYDFGILSELRTVLAYVYVLVMLGLDSALLKYLPLLRVAGGMPRFFKTLRGLMLMQLGVWACLLAVARFGGTFFNAFFHEGSGRFGLYLQLAVCFAVLDISMAIVTNVCQSWYETKRLAIVVIAGNALYIASLAVVLWLDWGIIGVLASTAFMNLAMVLALAPYARRLVRTAPGDAATAPSFGTILRFSLPIVANGLLNLVVWRQSEVIFLGHFRGAEVAGYFSLAYRNPQLLLEFVPLAIWPLVLAGMSDVYARDEGSLPRAVDLYFRLIYLLVVPIAAIGFAFARPLVPILFGSKMLPAALLTQLIFGVFSYSFLYTPMSMALYVMGKSWVNMLVFLCLAVINVGLDLAIIPRYGLWGAFVPTSLVLVIAVFVFHRVVKRFRPDVRAPFGFIARCYAAALPAALFGFVSYRWESPLALAWEAPLALALLVLGFRLVKVVGAEEKELIGRLPIPFRRQLISVL